MHSWQQNLVRLSRSPSLRGSGLKSSTTVIGSGWIPVSLFTREWIEIHIIYNCTPCNYNVSLFTREWIEIMSFSSWSATSAVSLFTREWIEIFIRWLRLRNLIGLPLYEGVDWNLVISIAIFSIQKSPSLRGSGLKSLQSRWLYPDCMVSLFTREWIEI